MASETPLYPPAKGMFDHLCTPWRWDYLRKNGVGEGCLFCLDERADEEGIIAKADQVYVILNRYPYNNGHLMIVPYRHIASLDHFSEVEQIDFMNTLSKAIQCLQNAYQPEGYNLGANIGAAAGAGIPGHFHMHVVPRWSGDTSFMSVSAAARVIPEGLPDTAAKLREIWSQLV